MSIDWTLDELEKVVLKAMKDWSVDNDDIEPDPDMAGAIAQDVSDWLGRKDALANLT